MKYLFAVLCMLTSSLCSAAQLSVSGQCQKEVTPDRVSVTLTSRALEKDPKSASAKASAQYEKLKAEIKKLNLKDSRVSTSGFNVNQEWDYNNGKRILRGYSATISLTAETAEVSRAGEVLDIAAKLNIEEVGTPSTFLSPALAKKEYESCLEVAIKHARAKAEKMAVAAGQSLGKLVTLNENKDNSQPIPLVQHRQMEMASDMTAGKQVSFDSRPSNVDVTISATYDLK